MVFFLIGFLDVVYRHGPWHSSCPSMGREDSDLLYKGVSGDWEIDLWEVEYMPSAGIQSCFHSCRFYRICKEEESGERRPNKIPGGAMERDKTFLYPDFGDSGHWREKLGKVKPDFCFLFSDPA